jgi:hypothetical protein
MDWYEKTDDNGNKSLHFWYKQKGELDGYTHLGATLPASNFGSFLAGNYSSMSMSTDFAENDFITQQQDPHLQCARASNLMAESKGATRTNYRNELVVANANADGTAGTANIDNFKDGIIRMIGFMEKGIPPVAGVDWGTGTNNPASNGGDGMAEHYINITGFSINMQKQQYPMGLSYGFNITGGTFNYADCWYKTGREGVNNSKYFLYNDGLMQRTTPRRTWTITNLRVK